MTFSLNIFLFLYKDVFHISHLYQKETNIVFAISINNGLWQKIDHMYNHMLVRKTQKQYPRYCYKTYLNVSNLVHHMTIVKLSPDTFSQNIGMLSKLKGPLC